MKANRVSALAVTAIGILAFGRSNSANAATEHYNKTISVLEVAGTSNCYLFKLQGVSQADTAVPDSPWFAIWTADNNAKQMLSLLLTMRASGMPVYRVLTSGSVRCGVAEVHTIDM